MRLRIEFADRKFAVARGAAEWGGGRAAVGWGEKGRGGGRGPTETPTELCV